jgi:hypothetical protein
MTTKDYIKKAQNIRDLLINGTDPDDGLASFHRVLHGYVWIKVVDRGDTPVANICLNARGANSTHHSAKAIADALILIWGWG